MLLITEKALEHPEFKEITSTYRYVVPETNKSDERYLYTTNWMMNPGYPTYYYEYVAGIKTGTTTRAGRCIVSTASKDGYNYICIVMGAKNEDDDENLALLECKRLFKWAFANIRLSTVANSTQTITVVDVDLSWNTDHVRLVPEEDVTLLIPTGNDAGSVMIKPIEDQTPKKINAPVEKGEVIGKASILYADEEIGTINLVAGDSVSRSTILWIFSRIRNAMSSTIFKLIAFVAVLLVIAYTLLLIRYKKRKRRKRQSVKPVRVDTRRR